MVAVVIAVQMGYNYHARTVCIHI